jgi:hypothetical protein
MRRVGLAVVLTVSVQINPLLPLTLTEGRLTVQVAAGAGARTLVVAPVTLPMP